MSPHPETHNLPSETTDEENTEAAAVRLTNQTREITLSLIVLFVTGSATYVSVRVALLYLVSDATASQLAIAGVAFVSILVFSSLVTGIYLGLSHSPSAKPNKS